jgi:putative endonuclease
VNQQIGKEAEDCAERHLIAQGLTTLARNVGCKYGEIDIIMQQGATVVFVEVRTRKHNRFPTAASTINYHKQQRLIRTASIVIQRMPALQDRPIRFDIVAYDTSSRNRQVQWIQQAFDASN